MEYPSDDQLLASAAQFLNDGHEEDGAEVLLSCSLEANYHTESDVTTFEDVLISEPWEIMYTEVVEIKLIYPRAAYDILSNKEHQITTAIHRALRAVLPTGVEFRNLIIQANTIPLIPDWRAEMLETARI